MDERDKAILSYLNQASTTPGMERWVILFQEASFGDPYDSLRMEYENGQEVAPREWLKCRWNDVATLIEQGYVEGTIRPGKAIHRVRISPQGKALVARGFVELPDTSAGSQLISFFGGAFGNVAISNQAQATISGSDTTQGSWSSQPADRRGKDGPIRTSRPLPGTESWKADRDNGIRRVEARIASLHRQPGAAVIELPPAPNIAVVMVPWWGLSESPNFEILINPVINLVEQEWKERWGADVRSDGLVLVPLTSEHGQPTAYHFIGLDGTTEGAIKGSRAGFERKSKQLNGELCFESLMRLFRVQIAIGKLLELEPPVAARLAMLEVSGYTLQGSLVGWKRDESQPTIVSDAYSLQASLESWDQAVYDDLHSQFWRMGFKRVT